MLDSTYELFTVRAPKRLDTLVCPALAIDLREKIQPGRGVVLDLSQTQFIELESAELILQGLLLAKRCNAHFSLRGVNSQVQQILETAGVLQHFRRKP